MITIIIITTTVEGYTVRARAQTVLSPVSAGHIRLTPCLYIYVWDISRSRRVFAKHVWYVWTYRRTRVYLGKWIVLEPVPKDRTRHDTYSPPPPRYFTVVPRHRSGRDTGGTFPPTSGLAFKRLFDGFPALQTIDTSPERRGERTGFKIKSYTFGRDPGFVEVPVFRILLDDSKNDGARGKRGDPPHRKLLLFPRQFTPKRTNSPTCYRH